MTIIDGHCHVGEGHYHRLSPDDLLRQMDACGVEKAIICPVDRHIAVTNREGNEYILHQVQAHPDRFIGFAAVNPWYGERGVEELDRAIERGLKGLKLNPSLQGYLLNDPLVYPLIERARYHGVLVYFHTGTMVHSAPFQLTELAGHFPDVRFVMGHMGTTDYWNDTIHAAKGADNVYMDTSLNNPASIKRVLAALGDGRIFFSSNAPVCTVEVEVHKVDRVCGADKELREKILFRNIRTLIQEV